MNAGLGLLAQHAVLACSTAISKATKTNLFLPGGSIWTCYTVWYWHWFLQSLARSQVLIYSTRPFVDLWIHKTNCAKLRVFIPHLLSPHCHICEGEPESFALFFVHISQRCRNSCVIMKIIHIFSCLLQWPLVLYWRCDFKMWSRSWSNSCYRC